MLIRKFERIKRLEQMTPTPEPIDEREQILGLCLGAAGCAHDDVCRVLDLLTEEPETDYFVDRHMVDHIVAAVVYAKQHLDALLGMLATNRDLFEDDEDDDEPEPVPQREIN